MVYVEAVDTFGVNETIRFEPEIEASNVPIPVPYDDEKLDSRLA